MTVDIGAEKAPGFTAGPPTCQNAVSRCPQPEGIKRSSGTFTPKTTPRLHREACGFRECLPDYCGRDL